MDYTKEIRSDDKKRVKTDVKTHIAAPAGGRAALWSAGGWPWRLAAAYLSGGRRGKEGGPAAGAMVCRGWMGLAMVRRRSAAAIQLYLISH